MSSAEVPLCNSRNNFERNQHDTFVVKLPDVAKLAKLQIGHDGSGMGAAWHLNRVEVTNTASGGERATFVADKWLDKKSGNEDCNSKTNQKTKGPTRNQRNEK